MLDNTTSVPVDLLILSVYVGASFDYFLCHQVAALAGGDMERGKSIVVYVHPVKVSTWNDKIPEDLCMLVQGCSQDWSGWGR